MTGAERIAAERRRQIEQEVWTPEHDDKHDDESLAWAAVCYAAPTRVFRRVEFPTSTAFYEAWPDSWDECWDKRPKGATREERIRALEKAGALIAAEIDRLVRAGDER